MPAVKSRRELYSDATKAALLEQATALFVERGFAGTSLDDVAAASLVTRGAVYHHFSGKKALFEEVIDRQGVGVVERVEAAAARHQDPWDGALAGLNAFLDECCDPVYGKLVWQEGPLALGWEGWRRCEQSHSYGLVERFVLALMNAGYLERKAEPTTVRIFFEMLGGAGLALAEAAEPDKPRVRDECAALMRSILIGLRGLASPN